MIKALHDYFRSLRRKIDHYLGKPIFEVWITVTDDKGRVEQHCRANSPVLAMIDLLYTLLANATLSIPDTGNTSRVIGAVGQNFRVGAGSGVTTYGIVVGSGTNAVTVSDYALQTQIAHGTGATQLSYGATSVGLPLTSGTSRQLTISRTLTGNPTSAVNVTEIGIYVLGSAVPYYFCIDRTLNSFTVGVGANKTVTYTIKVTV